jgi:hypothetical protein
MEQNDLERQPGRHLGDEVAATQRGHAIDDGAGHELNPFLDALDHPWVEGGRDNATQAGVAGIVGVDHGTEVVRISSGMSKMLVAPGPER